MSELPAGWRLATLGDIASVTMGQSPPGSSYNTDGIGLPFFQGKAEFGETHPTVAKWTTSGTKFAHPGDILMSVRAPVGPTNVADIDCVIGRGLAAIAADSTVVSQQYLILVIKHLEAGITSQGKGSTFDSISGADLRGTLVPVPPLDEQRRIVEILEEQLSRLEAGKSSITKNQARLTGLRNSIIESELIRSDFEMVRLHDLFNFYSGFAYKSNAWKSSGVPVVKIKNVKDGIVTLEGCSFVTEELALQTKSYEVTKGDLLFNMTGATLGKFGFYSGDDDARMNQRVGKFTPKLHDQINLKYFAYFLESPSTQQEIANLAKGAAQPNISPQDIYSLEISLPPIEIQNEIVGRLSEAFFVIERLQISLSAGLAQAASFKRSLLNAAFTGRLTKEPANV